MACRKLITGDLHGLAGVDYTHPDLGGCFGTGCRVAYGYNFIEDNDDPRDTCIGATQNPVTVPHCPAWTALQLLSLGCRCCMYFSSVNPAQQANYVALIAAGDTAFA